MYSDRLRALRNEGLKCLGFLILYFGIQTAVYEAFGYLSYTNPLGRFGDYFFNSTSCASMITSVSVFAVFGLIYLSNDKKILSDAGLSKIPPKGAGLAVLLGVSHHFSISYLLAAVYSIFPSLMQYSASEAYEAAFSGEVFIVEFIDVAIIVPFMEELLFRGIIFKKLRGVLPKRWAIVLSAVIFGAAHMNAEQLVYVTLTGILLAAVFDRYNSLTASFVIHAAFNASSFAVELLPARMSVPAVLGIIALSLAVFVFALWLVFKKKSSNEIIIKEKELL